MDKSLTLRNIMLYYYRYRGTTYYTVGLSGVVIAVSLTLIIFVIIPQINHVLSVQREIEVTEGNIQTMEKNQSYIATINSSQEKEQTDTVLAALPLSKDYAGIYTAIVSSARQSGVGLSDFQYQVGVSGETGEGNSVSEMTISLSLSGGPQAMQSFLTNIAQTLPLSEARVVSGDDELANVELVFFYGGEQVIQIDPKTPLVPLGSEKSRLLGELSQAKPDREEVTTPVTSSGSAFTESPF